MKHVHTQQVAMAL